MERHRLMAPTLGYHAMRVAWCRAALAALLHRWWAAIVVTVLGIGAGAAGAFEIMRSLAGALVLPLAWCAATGSAWTAPALAAQTLAGAGLVWVLRPLLLPRRWLEAERALPLPRAVQRRSDLALVALALLPWLALQAFGVVSLLAVHPPWLHERRAAALVALGAAALGSLCLGVMLLQARRRPRVARYRGGIVQRAPARRHWSAVLLWLPLWRGPARRCGVLLVTTSLALLLPVAGLAAWPAGGGWWLAALAAIALAAGARTAVLVREELGPLIDAAATLPLRLRRVHAIARMWPLVPLLSAQTALLFVARATRALPLAAFVAGSLAAVALLSASIPADPSTRAARALLMFALLAALASEVFA